jgi:hypothetical protein
MMLPPWYSWAEIVARFDGKIIMAKKNKGT